MVRKRIQARVHGRVQGVAFRESTRREGARLGLSGWVKNLTDGTVEVEFEGPAAPVAVLLAWLANGPPRRPGDPGRASRTSAPGRDRPLGHPLLHLRA